MSITGYAGMLNIKQLTPQLIPPPELYAGTAASFQLRLTNSKRHVPSFLIQLASADSQTSVVPFIGKQQTLESSVTFTFPVRGRCRLQSVRISSAFPVNFFTRFWTFDLEQEVVVFPRLMAIPGYADSTAGMQGAGSSHTQRGVDGELEKIAPYSGREPLKSIHWKLSARGEDLLVKEFGRQGVPPLMIRLDELPGKDCEERLSQAAWLIKRWGGERPVGLVCGDVSLAAGVGKQHEYLLLTELALYGLH